MMAHPVWRTVDAQGTGCYGTRCSLCLCPVTRDAQPADVEYCPPCAAAVARDPWLSRDPRIAAVSPLQIPAHIHRAVNAQAREAPRRLERAARLAALVPVEDLAEEPRPVLRGQQLGLWA